MAIDATIASIGEPVSTEDANLAPILSISPAGVTPKLNPQFVPDLPPELQPQSGDVLLAQSVWPWADLGAKGVPENWLYMQRRVQGTVALMTVQTPAGPKLVQANSSGQLSTNQPPTRMPDFVVGGIGPHSATYVAPPGSKAMILLLVDGAINWSLLSIVGVDSGNTYYLQNPWVDNTAYYTFPIIGELESGWTINITRRFLSGGTIRVFFATDNQSVFPITPNGGAMPLGTRPSAVSLDAVFGRLKSAPFNHAFIANEALTLVAGLPGGTVYCLYLNVAVVTVSALALVLEDDAPGAALANIDTTVTYALSHALGGAHASINNGVRIHNPTGLNSGQVVGELIYVQQ